MQADRQRSDHKPGCRADIAWRLLVWFNFTEMLQQWPHAIWRT
jgi:hypothetical protein